MGLNLFNWVTVIPTYIHLFLKLESSRDQLRREINDLLKDDGILIFPSWPTLPPFHNKPLGAWWSFMYTGIWNVCFTNNYCIN